MPGATCMYFLWMDLLSTTVLSGMVGTSHVRLHKFQLIKLQFLGFISCIFQSSIATCAHWLHHWTVPSRPSPVVGPAELSLSPQNPIERGELQVVPGEEEREVLPRRGLAAVPMLRGPRGPPVGASGPPDPSPGRQHS